MAAVAVTAVGTTAALGQLAYLQGLGAEGRQGLIDGVLTILRTGWPAPC